MSKQRLALDRAYRAIKSMLDNGEWYEPWNVLAQIEEALAEPKLEFWPGDVLICKEDDSKVTVANGNRGPLQLMNGKISIAWSDTVSGEYTIEQIKEMFYRTEDSEQESEITKYKKRIEELEELRVLAARNHDAIVDAIHKTYQEKLARKPLTDEKLWEMWVESPSDVLRFARAIERAHGIEG